MNEEEIIYLAGLFDGEGCITFRSRLFRKRGLAPQIMLTSCSPEIKELLKMHEYPAYQKGRREKHYEFRLSSIENILSFLENIRPFLRIKRPQADLMLKFCQSRQKRMHQPYTHEELELYFQLISTNSNKGKKKPLIQIRKEIDSYLARGRMTLE